MTAGEAIGYAFALGVAVPSILLGLFGLFALLVLVVEYGREWWRG